MDSRKSSVMSLGKSSLERRSLSLVRNPRLASHPPLRDSLRKSHVETFSRVPAFQSSFKSMLFFTKTEKGSSQE